jgi:hypothetical protein
MSKVSLIKFDFHIKNPKNPKNVQIKYVLNECRHTVKLKKLKILKMPKLHI